MGTNVSCINCPAWNLLAHTKSSLACADMFETGTFSAHQQGPLGPVGVQHIDAHLHSTVCTSIPCIQALTYMAAYGLLCRAKCWIAECSSNFFYSSPSLICPYSKMPVQGHGYCLCVGGISRGAALPFFQPKYTTGVAYRGCSVNQNLAAGLNQMVLIRLGESHILNDSNLELLQYSRSFHGGLQDFHASCVCCHYHIYCTLFTFLQQVRNH